ncbi:hypothetical protein ACFVTF_10390 [Kitasatospora sp. NPDC057940]|uniref:hypothetical protein n=1 Tax=Kitasatospora sp. NPDC057940 TaxID=3346285 RepID=UPI0036DED9CB
MEHRVAARPARRTLLTGLAIAAPVLLAGCSASSGKAGKKAGKEAGAARASDAGGEALVMIIRHGEKPDGGHPGLDENGHHDGKSLTERGWSRARALPTLFVPPAPGLRTPARILAAADQGPLAGAHRMRQTVTPLAAKLGLTVDTDYAESQETALAGAALAGPQPTLICWEHSRIPRIVEALGAAGSGAPATWPDRFDLVWVFARPAGGAWTFQEVRQHLLDGDA